MKRADALEAALGASKAGAEKHTNALKAQLAESAKRVDALNDELVNSKTGAEKCANMLKDELFATKAKMVERVDALQAQLDALRANREEDLEADPVDDSKDGVTDEELVCDVPT